VGTGREGWQDRGVARNGRNEPVLITDAPEDPEKERRRREVRYVAMMITRGACLIGAALLVANRIWLWQVWASLCVVGAVVLPWLAVLIANDRPPKKHGAAAAADGVTAQPALERREYKVIDIQ